MTGDLVIDVVRLALAAMFAVAGAAKLADLSGATRAARDFGAPQPLSRPVAVLLSGVEIAIAAGLLFSGTARSAAAAGAAVLVLLAAAVALARLRGRTPDCHCFGRLHSAPAGWGVAARNVVLAAAAAFVATQPTSAIDLTAFVALGVGSLVVGQGLLSYTLVHRYGKALRQIEELGTRRQHPSLEIGTQAPDFSLDAASGGSVALGGLLSPGLPVLLVFADPECGPCHALMPKVAAWQHTLANELTVAVVSRSTHEENLAVAREHGLANVMVQDDREVSDSYGVWATPSALLIGADGRIEHPPIAGAEAIEGLIDTLAPDERQPEPEPERAARELVAATAVAGGLALSAASARASTGRQDQQPPNAELQAIDGALKAAGPRLVAAAQRSAKAIRAQATLMEGKSVRAKRAAARKALAAERREVLALKARVARLSETSREAHNVKIIVDNCLSLLAKSLAKRQQAIGASTPELGLRLLADGQQLFLQSVAAGAAAGKLLGQRR